MTPVPAGTDRLSAERLADIEQQCCASYDAYHAAEWCHAANDLLTEVARLTQERDTLIRLADALADRMDAMDDRAHDFGRTWEIANYRDFRAASSPVAATTDEGAQ